MNLRQLEYFVAVAETKSISSAARKIHMAQPPLSRQIQMLEEELDTPLILRNNRGIALTEAGQRLYLEASSLFSRVEEIKSSVIDSGAALRGKIHVPVCYSTLSRFLEKVDGFHKLYPMVQFALSHDTVPEMVRQVQAGSVDMALLCTRNIQDDYLEVRPLFHDSMCLVMHRDMDPCPDSDVLDPALLEEIPLCLIDITHYPYPSCTSALLEFCKEKNLRPNVIYEYRDTAVAMMMAIRGMAATVLQSQLVAGYMHPALCTKQIAGLSLESQTSVVWNPQKLLSRAAKEFLNYLIQSEPEKPSPGKDVRVIDIQCG